MVSDPGVDRAGVLEAVLRTLEPAAVEFTVFTGVPGEPTVEVVEAAAAARTEWGGDSVIGVGGGAVMDVAKVVAALATNGGSLGDRWGNDLFSELSVPTALVPTTAGTGSEVSQFAVFTDRAAGVKKVTAGRALVAELAVVDANLTLTLPPHITADSGMDALVHAVEAYLGRGASEFSGAMALRAVQLIAGCLPRAYRDPGDRGARAGMMTASTLAGMAFNAAGLGAIHALGYPLDTHHNVPHGRTNAVFLTPVLRAFGQESAAQIADLGRAAGTGDFVAWAQSLLETLDIPARLRDYGVPEERARALGREGWEGGQRLLGNSPRLLTVEEAEEIYARAW